jgi:hypothetical protein
MKQMNVYVVWKRMHRYSNVASNRMCVCVYGLNVSNHHCVDFHRVKTILNEVLVAPPALAGEKLMALESLADIHINEYLQGKMNDQVRGWCTHARLSMST